MNRVEMLRQSVAASIKPIEEPPPTEPPPNPEPTLSEPKPPSRLRQRKSPPQAPTQSLDELAELAGQMGASLAKLSEECRSMLPRIMDEPKQQTAAMLQEVRDAMKEMKTILAETSNAARDVQRAAVQVKGLSLKKWLHQMGTCLIVSGAMLIGFMIWLPWQTREERLKELKQAIVEANMETLRQAKQENLLNKPATGQQKQSNGKQKPLDAAATKSGSAPKPPTETPQDSSSTNGAPPK